MYIVGSYSLAVFFCFITMLCWGSWGNTQKLAAKSWRYELFYWDYVIGMLLFSLIVAFTLGSTGTAGRSFLADCAQASPVSVGWVLFAAVIFNISNILLSASISLAGMSVAFPVGVGLALVIGVLNNLFFHPKEGDSVALLLLGVALVVVAIVCNGIASRRSERSDRRGLGEPSPNDKLQTTVGEMPFNNKKGESSMPTVVSNEQKDPVQNKKGIILAVLAGIIMSFFSALVYNGVDINNFQSPAAGMLTPYTGMVIFTLGIFLSNFIINTIVMKKPFVGSPVTYREYFAGNAKTHLVGMLGGSIWCLGTVLNYICAGTAGAAVSYALGQGAPLIAAIWGVFIWKEFKGADKSVYGLLGLMFGLFIAGLAVIILAGN